MERRGKLSFHLYYDQYCYKSCRAVVATPTPTETEDGETSNEEENVTKNSEDVPTNQPGMWEETFKTHHDSKPYGKKTITLFNGLCNSQILNF